MRALLRAGAGVAGSGRFVTAWSLVVTAVLSATVMAPTLDAPPSAAAAEASAATWACVTAVLLAIGAAERTVTSPRLRAVVVAVGVIACAAARPALVDAWLRAVDVAPPATWQLPFRIATNVIVWTVALTATAVVVDALRSLRATTALLRSVAAALATAHERRDAFDRAARRAVRDAARSLHRATGLLPGAPDPSAAVARMSAEHLRASSHALTRLARGGPGAAAAGSPAPHPAAPRRTRGTALRVPPRGAVATLYIACLLPYAARTAPPAMIAAALVVAVAGGMTVDRLARARAVAGRRRAAAVFVALSLAVGVLLSLLAGVGGAAPIAAVVPALAYTAFAVGAAVCTGVLHALRAERRRLSGAIAAEQRATRAGARTARDALERAAELLHRDGQGACALFALEHPRPAPADVAALAARLDDLADRVAGVFDAPRPASDAASLAALLSTWRRAITVDARLDPRATAALDAHPALARDAYDIVAEGLLNAVKHGGARRVDLTIDLVATGAGRALRIAVRSPQPPPAGARLRPASAARALGARLHAAHGGAVLEAQVPLPPAPVVSAEHPHRPAQTGL